MKKKDLVKIISKLGATKAREGSSHEIWKKGDTTQAVPRHREISDLTARAIIKAFGG